MESNRLQLGIGLGFFLALATAWLVLFPGLSGGWLLDDVPSLGPLRQLHAHPGFGQLTLYLTSTETSRLGRIIPMLSFAAQYYAWPVSPSTFKHVNLMLHLLNGCLLFWLLLRIQRLRLPLAPDRLLVPALAAFLWLAHPLQVSTVMYVVQRMAQFSMLFSLLALLCYVHGRSLPSGRAGAAAGWMIGGLAGFGLLGVLSKENSALLPFFVVVLEMTLLARVPWRLGPPAWKWWLLGTPVALMAGYLALNVEPLILRGYASRDFSLGERLLTECQVLLGYLHSILLPRPGSLRFFFDDLPVAHSLWQPATLASVLGVLALIASALALRRRWPVYAFGVLWFFAGHLMESTVIGLELAFEHRNYVPAVGPLFAVASAVPMLFARLRTPLLSRAVAVMLALFGLLFLYLTADRAALWGNPLRLAATWAAEQPGSLRARMENAGLQRVAFGDAAAERLLTGIATDFPEDGTAPLVLVLLECPRPEPDPDKLRNALARLRVTGGGFGPVSVMEEIIGLRSAGRCPAVTPTILHSFADALLGNPRFRYQHALVHYLKGRVYRYQGRLNEALAELDLSFARSARSTIPIIQANWLTDAGRSAEAAEYLQRARRATRHNPLFAWLMRSGLQDWDMLLDRDLAESPAKPADKRD
ncbi:MAG: hypothetical protein LJE84_03670 [Gammaproteobacteria bacterium]|nr:hypothetical protein [Gammaproteobacteria bacterium]